jgi:phosphoglycerate kinase
MVAIPAIDTLSVSGKRVFIRVDFNVPLNEQQQITDDTRIRASLPTIRYVIEKKAKVILASHLGRPKGKVVSAMSLAPVAQRLSELLGQRVRMASDCVGSEVEKTISELEDGEVVLLENLRFHKGETDNDKGFAQALAALADVYINDAFGSAHRAHASTEGIVHFVKDAGVGFLMKKEIQYLEEALKDPARPFLTLVGGAKVSDKIDVLRNLLKKVDAILIGGGMANTFLAAKGYNLKASPVEVDKQGEASSILEEAAKRSVEILLPVDVVVAARMDPGAQAKVVDIADIPEGWMALDIGPKTRQAFIKRLKKAKTIVWNGPMGVFEMSPFKEGTYDIARALAGTNAMIIVGGGDTVSAVDKAGVKDRMTHISTGGGASLEYLEGRALPGIEALRKG